MKKQTLLALFMVLGMSLSMAQPARNQAVKERAQELEARKVAYITEQLSLTTAEADKFWPVYQNYNKKRQELTQNQRGWRFKQVNWDEISDAEAEKIADEEILRMQRMHELRASFHAEMKKVLPIKKVAMFYEAERDFNREMLREQRMERRDQRMNRGRRPGGPEQK